MHGTENLKKIHAFIVMKSVLTQNLQKCGSLPWLLLTAQWHFWLQEYRQIHHQWQAVPWLKAVSRWTLAADDRVRCLPRPCGICGGHSGDVSGFCPSTSVSLHQLLLSLTPYKFGSWQCLHITHSNHSNPELQRSEDFRFRGKAELVSGLFVFS
jgi:hypothetical protein